MEYPKIRDYPREWIFNGTVYKLKFKRKMPHMLLGQCSPDGLIEVKLGMSRKETFETFIHECIHAIEFEFGEYISHATIHKLEKPFAMFFVENYKF